MDIIAEIEGIFFCVCGHFVLQMGLYIRIEMVEACVHERSTVITYLGFDWIKSRTAYYSNSFFSNIFFFSWEKNQGGSNSSLFLLACATGSYIGGSSCDVQVHYTLRQHTGRCAACYVGCARGRTGGEKGGFYALTGGSDLHKGMNFLSLFVTSLLGMSLCHPVLGND